MFARTGQVGSARHCKIAICFDLDDPATIRQMANSGIDVLAGPRTASSLCAISTPGWPCCVPSKMASP